MSRRDDLSHEDRRIWSRVAGSVTPSKPKKAARVTPGAVETAVPAPHPTGKTPNKRPAAAPTVVVSRTPAAPHRAVPEELEPRRQRRLSRERDPIEAKID